MQDRFKFRAWDKKAKKMRDVDSIAFHNRRSSFDYDDSNLPKVVNIWGYDIIRDKDIILHREIKDVILIQSTGLKDKNGELVYFDDFIKLDDGIVCIIKQIEDINDIEYGRVVAIPVFYLNQKYQTRYIPTVIAESEKVGNLRENPELLESEEE